MTINRDNLQPGDQSSDGDSAELGRLLDARGRTQRSALSKEALERIASMSDLQLPMAAPALPVVIARIGHAPSRRWRLAAAIAAVAGLVGAGWLVARGLSVAPGPNQDSLVQDAPEGRQVPGATPEVDAPNRRSIATPSAEPRRLAADHVERAIASTPRSAATVVVALSGARQEPALQYHDLDDALAGDFAPLFHSGSLLDGAGTTYEDLRGELASLASPGSFR
ncbi:MAG: hypothetical protein RL354_1332 [Planctomycetota bacterium]